MLSLFYHSRHLIKIFVFLVVSFISDPYFSWCAYGNNIYRASDILSLKPTTRELESGRSLVHSYLELHEHYLKNVLR